MDNKRFYFGKYIVNIEWEVDEYPDLSWLGKPTEQRGEFVVDRKEGLLLGEWSEFLVSIPAGELNLTADDFYLDRLWYSYDMPQGSAFEKAEAVLTPIVEAVRIYCEEGWEVEYDERDETFYVQLEGYRILRDDLGNTYDRNEYRYFDVEGNHLPHKPQNWAHVDRATKDAIIAKHGSLENQDIEYALDDWQRWESLCDGWWSMVGCVVTIEDEDENELGYASLWGIEDDSDGTHIKEIEIELLHEALIDAGLGHIKAERVWNNYEDGRYEAIS